MDNEVGGYTMGAHRKIAPHSRGRRRAFVTVFCSMLVFAAGLGQAVIPAANAGGPSLTMGQVDTTSGGQLAAAQDSLNVDLDQWANKPGQGWQNGDLNKNNSAYHEDEVVPFRLAIEGLGAGSHTIHLNYDFTAGGHEAYDFLASYNVTEHPNLCATGGGAVSSMCKGGLPAPDSKAFPADPFAPGSPTKAGLTVSGAQTFSGVPRNLLLFGGTITNISVPTHTGPVSNQSNGDMVITFSTAGSSALFAWGAHIADSNYWVTTSGDPNGAAMVSGAPWHMRTQGLDNSGNKNQDRSIQPSAVIKLIPAIAVTKSCPAAATVGDSITYTIEVSNAGADQLNGITVTDPVLGGDLSGSFADTLAPGASESHTFKYTLTGSPDPLKNTVTVDATGAQDATAVTDSADCTTDVLFPDLHISKTADAASVSAGDPIGYTVTVTNTGEGVARDVSLTDTLPTNAGLSWSVAGTTGGWSCSITAGVLSCGGKGFDLAPGASATAHITSPTTSATCGTVNNSATSDASNQDQVSTGVVSITVNCAAVEITKTAEDAVVNAGDTIGYTISVHNAGAGTATAVTVTDTLPTNDGLSWSIDGGTGANNCSIKSGVLGCQFGSMAAGATKTVHITSPTTFATCGQVVNAASATTANDGNPSTGNATITVNCPDISITKTPDASMVDAADQVGFTITVTNAGPGTAYNTILSDTLPANDGLAWSIDGGTGQEMCGIDEGTLTCDFGDMGVTSYSVHISSDTDATTCGRIHNTATVTIDNGLGDYANASIAVNCPNLGIDITKTGPTYAHVGDTITYDFAVSLTTPEPLSDILVTDPNCNEGAPVYVNGDDGNGTLEPGEVWNYTCTHVVTAADPYPTLPNTATVSGTADDGRSTTDEASWNVQLITPGIDIVKTVNPISGEPGQTVTYTYVVTNTGDTTLYDVSVDDDIIGHIGDVAELDTGASVTLTKDWVLPSQNLPITNVGTATGTDVLGTTVSANDDAVVTIVLAANNPPKPPKPTAFTGTDALRFGAMALLLLAVGITALVIGRRRTGAA
jgi:uncharacterized repeat protein (TIGR01451 family)